MWAAARNSGKSLQTLPLSTRLAPHFHHGEVRGNTMVVYPVVCQVYYDGGKGPSSMANLLGCLPRKFL